VHTLGVYTADYIAVDAMGTSVTVTINVTVIEVDPAEVHTRAAAVLEQILRDDMLQVEKARAIFDWVTRNVAYAADIDHESVYGAALQALVHRRGDCFVFYAISEVLLTMADIPNVRLTRYGGFNRHYWNLVNPDDLGWHHFDTTPLRVREINRFMFTASQAEEFNRIIHQQTGERDYFTFDPDTIDVEVIN